MHAKSGLRVVLKCKIYRPDSVIADVIPLDLMKYPKRTSQHIKETASWKVLESKIPSNWIIRDLSERDYGIDAYIELVREDGSVTGELCSIQLKGTDEIKWHTDDALNGQASTFSGVSTTTVNYWMGLPVPVFLIVAELSEQRAFFVSVKDQIRDQYAKLQKQETLSFQLRGPFELGTGIGLYQFLAQYHREKYFAEFSRYVLGFISYWPNILEFIKEQQMRDVHLLVEEHIQLQFIHIQQMFQFLTNAFGIGPELNDINLIYEEDRTGWADGESLHQSTLVKHLPILEDSFFELLAKLQHLILDQQREFWTATNSVLYDAMLNLNVDEIIACRKTAE